MFADTVLATLNHRLGEHKFAVATTSKANLESDLTITEGGISIENKGKGRQCFIKTEFALGQNRSANPRDVLLLEEPENHLSHVNMKKLVSRIAETEEQQLIVATHSTLVASRLNLRNAVLLNSSNYTPAYLRSLSKETAAFFVKAPDNNVLEFVLSKRVILVEGDAEYMLLSALFEKEMEMKLEDRDIHMISVGGTSFKRYLELARLLEIRTAAIRDNDRDFKQNCVVNYEEYVSEHIRIFADTDEDQWTFEVSLYEHNIEICDKLFFGGKSKLTPQEYMLKNKTEAAYRLLENCSDLIKRTSVHSRCVHVDQRVILAVAGSGKTSYLVDTLRPDERFVLLTYTENNYVNLRERLLNRYKVYPADTRFYTYFSFLYTFFLRPLFADAYDIRGINWDSPPDFRRRKPKGDRERYFDRTGRIYASRMASFISDIGSVSEIRARLRKYFDRLLVDEVQDFAGHDFNFLFEIASENIDATFVGDFYQHTYDTSRDGAVNRNLHKDYGKFRSELERKGFEVDEDTLSHSHRCSPTVCAFVADHLGWTIFSHRTDKTTVRYISDHEEAEALFHDHRIVKLFYQSHSRFPCYSDNWGASKGIDHYDSVCVVLNNKSDQHFKRNQLNSLPPTSRNKLYVACTRAKGDLYLVPEGLYRNFVRLHEDRVLQ